MTLLLRWSLLVFLSVSLTACGTIKGWFSSDDEELNQPAELEKIVERVRIKKLWSTGVGDGQGQGLFSITPVIDGDTIYAASAEGEVKAVERNRGKLIWKENLDRALSGGVGYYGGYLFLGSSEGEVLKLDAGSGELLWSARLNGEILAAPQGDGRIVAVQSYDGKLHGLDFDSGEKLWTHDSNVPVLTIRGTSTPILDNGRIYAGFANGRVLALDAQTGAVAWEVRVAISQGRSEIERIVDVDGTMVLQGQDLYAASYQGNLVAIDVAAGRKVWQQPVSSYTGVSQGFGNVYVTDEEGSISAYLRNGQGLRWQQGDLSYRRLSRPVPVSSYVAVTDLEGILHLVSQVDGEFVGREKVDGDGVRADMLSDGNKLYVFGNSGKLVAYEVTARE